MCAWVRDHVSIEDILQLTSVWSLPSLTIDGTSVVCSSAYPNVTNAKLFGGLSCGATAKSSPYFGNGAISGGSPATQMMDSPDDFQVQKMMMLGKRGILRNKNEYRSSASTQQRQSSPFLRNFADEQLTYDRAYSSANNYANIYHTQPSSSYHLSSQHRFDHHQNANRFCCLEAILRPCVAEFFSVFFCLFIYNLVDSELRDRHILFFNRILTLAAADAITVLIFYNAFQTLVNGEGSNYFCGNWVGGDWQNKSSSFSIYHNRAIVFAVDGMATLHRARINAAIRISSISYHFQYVFSLLLSTVSWNPLLPFGLAVFSILQSDYSPFLNHYVFWLGPIIGSLFGCFLFRLIFAPDEKRLMNCFGCSWKRTTGRL
ncbi:unnamed protein product [Anisakis simplex]|uniref:G_PROTEIN_RECEP_F1_2 domain-containing protein n=1 Tax=Anisakis simplex TaxID=6269 RepID=A0A0M3JQR8_ANISI|nr:unnamed protein product [Anisakis simplex]